jgi:hypothetical protein
MGPLKNKPNAIGASLLLLALCLLMGCQSWYKRGADGAQLTKDKQQCQSETGASSGQAFSDCMQQAGWHQTTKAAKPARVDREDAADADAQETTPMVTVDTKPHKTTSEPPETTFESPEVTSDTPVSSVQADSVGAWFKFGASTEQLERDQGLCRDTSEQTEAVFMACMQRKGWRPVGSRPSPQR